MDCQVDAIRKLGLFVICHFHLSIMLFLVAAEAIKILWISDVSSGKRRCGFHLSQLNDLSQAKIIDWIIISVVMKWSSLLLPRKWIMGFSLIHFFHTTCWVAAYLPEPNWKYGFHDNEETYLQSYYAHKKGFTVPKPPAGNTPATFQAIFQTKRDFSLLMDKISLVKNDLFYAGYSTSRGCWLSVSRVGGSLLKSKQWRKLLGLFLRFGFSHYREIRSLHQFGSD